MNKVVIKILITR